MSSSSSSSSSSSPSNLFLLIGSHRVKTNHFRAHCSRHTLILLIVWCLSIVQVCELEDENDLLVLTHQDLKDKIDKLKNPVKATEIKDGQPGSDKVRVNQS